MRAKISRLSFIGIAVVLVCPAHARLVPHPALIDIREELLPKATVIFRGRVVAIQRIDDGTSFPGFVATFEPDRWYIGTPTSSPQLAFHVGEFIGHNCLNFAFGEYWVVFANRSADGTFELADDCFGAFRISRQLARADKSEMLEQMEADFEVGVSDPDPAARILSIQRIANLRLASSRPFLHRVLETSSGDERWWIVLAAVRAGDGSVLSDAQPVFETLQCTSGTPACMIVLSLRFLHDRAAVPPLINGLRKSHNPMVQAVLLNSLGDVLRDERALPVIAAFLGNPDKQVKYNALVGVWNLTHNDACRPDPSNDEKILVATQRCKWWWDTEGRQSTIGNPVP